MRLLYPLAAALLCAMAGGAMAQTSAAPPPDSDDILVEGRRIPREEASRAAADMLRRQAYTPEDGVYARYLSPACVQVVGLQPDAALRVKRVVEEIAIDVGAPVAAGKCKPNLMIAFTNDGRDLAQTLARARRVALLLNTRPYESEPFLKAHLPV